MGDKNPNKLKKKKKTAEKATVQPIMTTETSAAKKPKKQVYEEVTKDVFSCYNHLTPPG